MTALTPGTIGVQLGYFHMRVTALPCTARTSVEGKCRADEQPECSLICHSKNPLAVTMQRRPFENAALNEGLVAIVSAQALMHCAPIFMSFAQDGIKPKRSRSSWRFPVSGLSRTTGASCVGAML
jgi:hypothetical protein